MKLLTRITIALLIAVAGGGAVVFFLVRANMQNMVKQPNRDQNESVRAELPPLRRPEIVIKKRDRVLDLLDEGKLIKSYTIVLGFAPEGDKEKEGDGKTPEGEFYLFTKNRASRFHLSLGVSYPSKEDAKRGLDARIISKAEHGRILRAIDSKKTPPQKTALGGEIYIHGGGITGDWTLGCIAMKNEDIEELFNVLPVGIKIMILP